MTPKPPRWRTREFYVYYAVLLVCWPYMAWTAMSLSQESHPNYYILQRRIKPGWIFSRNVDHSDAQYRQFRSGLPSLLLLATAYLAASYAWAKWKPTSFDQRIRFVAVAGISVILLLHGASAAKILILLYGNFFIARSCRGRATLPYLVWMFNCGLIFCNQHFNGYPFGSLSSSLSFLDKGRFGGIISRWQIGFNITILRLISFAIDQHSPKQPQSNEYTFSTYIAYVLYPPLYIAGPIITFDDFVTQIKTPPTFQPRTILAYAFRWAVCFIVMELILHYMYVVAIKDASFRGIRAWANDTPFELAVIGFWNLIIIWLKLLLPWRLFRLWALADGIDPPENMVRCMLNNYSVTGFWRSWHRSYNLWLIKYIYAPLGGSKNVMLSTALVFTFVALWHDLSLRLLAWGWAVSLFVLPEILCRRFLPAQKYDSTQWFRHLAAAGGVANIFMLITANLIGFAIGTEGVNFMLKEITSSLNGAVFLTLSFVFFFSLVQVMFEYREEEIRQGIYRRY